MKKMEQEIRDRGKIYFVSDVHLDIRESPSKREQQFLELLAKIKSEASHLYIVGDLFDFWFEYKFAVPGAYLSVLAGLLDLTSSGIEVSYIPGNHDFWMRDYLTRQIGVKLTDDFHEVEHFNRRILITHGDGLRRDDRGYRFIKFFFRNRLCVWLYSLLPVDLAYRLAMGTSSASRAYTENRDNLDSTDYIEFARRKVETGLDAVVMGHVHKPEIVNLGGGLYVNTGDFFRSFSYVVLDETGFSLKSLTF